MALNLVAYDESGSESDEEMDESPVATASVSKPISVVREIVGDEDSDIPKPSEKELRLAEIARREKANLRKTELLGNISQKKNGKIMIGIPSLADVISVNRLI